MRNKDVTMSGLLQALDGPVNKSGPVIVATTNRYEELDPALIRPGVLFCFSLFFPFSSLNLIFSPLSLLLFLPSVTHA
jgi:hypothetical protein